MIAKTTEEVEGLRAAGRVTTEVVREVLALVLPGVSSMELDAAARTAIAKRGALPSFLGYKGRKDLKPYPAAICVSIQDEVVHSPPSEEKILHEGDIVSLDFGLSYQGMYMDTAHTLCIGQCDVQAQKLVNATREALTKGIAAAKVGGRLGDIGEVVSAVARRNKLGVVKILSGHGVGAAVHELPYVPNFGKKGEGEKIEEGLVLAIEPMFTLGSGELVLDADSFTWRSKDGTRGAHFEHTVLITKSGPEILTAI